MARVCAVIVTANRPALAVNEKMDLLRNCVRSLIAQTRPVDRIVVVDNATTDGTVQMLENEFGNLLGLGTLAVLPIKEYAGGAGAVGGGMRFAHCNKFDWVWVMDDGVEVAPDCLKRMIAFENQADLIQVRGGSESHQDVFPDTAAFIPVTWCDFTAALFKDRVLNEIGFPDVRYFHAADDVAYGQLVAERAPSICLNYQGIVKHTPDAPPLNRATFYLSIRNRFLARANLAASPARPSGPRFFFQTFAAVVRQLGRALETPGGTVNAMATIDGLRDGLHKRFDRLPQS